MKYNTIVAGVIGMTRHVRMLRVLLAAVVALVLGAVAPVGWAHDDDGNEIPFAEANLFFELNDTDGDLGIHALIDGDAWKKLEIEDPNERRMLLVWVAGRLRRQGLTEIFFESAEPTFDELPPDKFFRRFPAGEYEIEGRTLDGVELESIAELTHVMPAPPGNITINGEPARPADGSDCNEDELPEVSNPVIIKWDAVTTSHPTIGESDADIEIVRYQAVAEWEDDDENVFVSSVDIQPDDVVQQAEGTYSVTVSPQFFVNDTEVKFEVLVREASGNQTAVESCPFQYVMK